MYSVFSFFFRCKTIKCDVRTPNTAMTTSCHDSYVMVIPARGVSAPRSAEVSDHRCSLYEDGSFERSEHYTYDVFKVYCIFGVGLPTTNRLIWSNKSFPHEQPREIRGKQFCVNCDYSLLNKERKATDVLWTPTIL